MPAESLFGKEVQLISWSVDAKTEQLSRQNSVSYVLTVQNKPKTTELGNLTSCTLLLKAVISTCAKQLTRLSC